MNWYKLLVPIVVLLMQSCSGQVTKINGVSYVAARDTISEAHVNPVVNVNANYAAIMPFGFIRDLTHPEIIYNTERQWFGETREGVKQYVEELNKKNIKIMLKPQIWVWRGEYTGFIAMETEDKRKSEAEVLRLAKEVETLKKSSFETTVLGELKNSYFTMMEQCCRRFRRASCMKAKSTWEVRTAEEYFSATTSRALRDIVAS